MFTRHNDADPSADPLSDEQAMAQVIDLAAQIAKTADLQHVSGGFSFESCNDQGDPPYRARVDMTFDVPAGVERNAYFEQIAATMVAHGWSAGPQQGKQPFGTVIRKDGVWAEIWVSPFMGADGAVQIFGECRNVTDHRGDGMANGFSINDRLRAG